MREQNRNLVVRVATALVLFPITFSVAWIALPARTLRGLVPVALALGLLAAGDVRGARAAACTPSPTRLCLLGGRFAATLTWSSEADRVDAHVEVARPARIGVRVVEPVVGAAALGARDGGRGDGAGLPAPAGALGTTH